LLLDGGHVAEGAAGIHAGAAFLAEAVGFQVEMRLDLGGEVLVFAAAEHGGSFRVNFLPNYTPL
jgi:hypothetical protein